MRDALGAVQSVLVLGGGSDIAAATTRKLVAGRARTVVLAGPRKETMAPVAESLRAAGATTVDLVDFDADDVDGHEAFVRDVFERYGDLDVVLLAAGVLGDQERSERDPDHAVWVLRTNLVGPASVALRVAKRLRAQGHGALVVLSSVAAERPRRANYVYGASKAGLDALGQGLGDSLVGSGACVLVVRPGFVHTKMTRGRKPAPLSTTPEVVADAIVGGLRSGAHTVWAPGTLRWLMAGMRHLPRPLWRRIAR